MELEDIRNSIRGEIKNVLQKDKPFCAEEIAEQSGASIPTVRSYLREIKVKKTPYRVRVEGHQNPVFVYGNNKIMKQVFKKIGVRED